MIFEIRTVRGQTREDNRDCAGAMFDGERGLFVIVDGTSKPGSGKLARGFVDGVITTYRSQVAQGANDATHELTAELIVSILAELHSPLFAAQTGSACYLIGVVANGLLTVAYEGDCCLGIANQLAPIDWLTTPHCLANWRRDRPHRELAGDPARNRITRCYKASRKPEPELLLRTVLAGERLVFATDGFWAQMSDARQADALAAPASEINDIDDDVTWIDVRI